MPAHDWTRVKAGIFHHFHQGWITAISRALNGGLLPPGYYALAEQIAGGVGPDVLTLEGPTPDSPPAEGGGVSLATQPPKVELRVRTEADRYAAKADALVIRHTSGHRVVAMVEIVSPGNKSTRSGLRSFVEKAAEALRAGVHLRAVDVLPPGPRDPQGIHHAIWDELTDSDFTLPEGRRLTAVAYLGGPCQEAFVQPFAVGQPVPEMPVFLRDEEYVPLPLEPTYQRAWEDVPAFWREVLEGTRPAGPSA